MDGGRKARFMWSEAIRPDERPLLGG